jgi:hypothetical protein
MVIFMKSRNNDGHPFLRKAFAVLMLLLLLAVLGRMVVGAVSFFAENAERPETLEGMEFTITGNSCTLDDDTADCCANTCTQWCGAKGGKAYKAGVVSAEKTSCKCICSPETAQ